MTYLRFLPLLFALALVGPGCTTTEPGDGDDDDTGGDDDDDASTGGDCDPATAAMTYLTPDELALMLAEKDFELINVHIPDAGEIPGTDAHLAFTDVDAIEEYLGHDLQAKAVLYCRSGPMSTTAGNALLDRGYCNLFDLPVGMNGWEAEGYEIVE